MPPVARAQCPACGSPKRKHLFAVKAFRTFTPVVRCTECNLVFKSLVPNAADLASIYGPGYVHFVAEGALTPGELRSAGEKVRKALTLWARSAPPAILDYGCGSGRFVKCLAHLGFSAEGFDPYSAQGRDHGQRLLSRSWDIIFMLNVLEHVVDPLAEIQRVVGLLTKGGVLVINCPFGRSIACRLYADRWVHVALEEHLTFWGKRSLLHLLRRSGMRGQIKCRVGGAPFPFGKVRTSKTAPRNTESKGNRGLALRTGFNLQGNIVAYRLIQFLVSATRTGDYIECIARK
jgi:hypothetical protein